MRVDRYAPGMAQVWDAFARNSKNGTFLFQRSYMEYHADRYSDHSLLVFDDADRLTALLPANEREGRLISHGGLTYGGIVSGGSMTTPRMLATFDAIRSYLSRAGIPELDYKAIPHIYHRIPAEEDLYALFRADARLYRVDVLSAIPVRAPPPLQERRVRMIRTARRSGLEVARSGDFGGFWAILEANLMQAHGVRPVHTIAEISALAARFPEEIRLHVCLDHGLMVAGVVIYDTPMVAHAQYIASSPRGRELGALDLLISHLAANEYSHRAYFDLGISNEQEGKALNVGLIDQKEGFGARAVVQQFYRVSVS